ncbi:DUF4253 domain-containing protein [Streptomyces sp. NPDC055006]
MGRAAGLPAAIDWSGPVNYENDVARLCAILRSWDDRFGVQVVALSYARLDLSVAAPPQTLDKALAVAAEHFAFCPDNIWQGYGPSVSTRRRDWWATLTGPSGGTEEVPGA